MGKMRFVRNAEPSFLPRDDLKWNGLILKEEETEKNNKMGIRNSKLVCCKLYISESLNMAAMEAIERAAKVDPEAAIVNRFEDRDYNRVRYTLVSYIADISVASRIAQQVSDGAVDRAGPRRRRGGDRVHAAGPCSRRGGLQGAEQGGDAGRGGRPGGGEGLLHRLLPGDDHRKIREALGLHG